MATSTLTGYTERPSFPEIWNATRSQSTENAVALNESNYYQASKIISKAMNWMYTLAQMAAKPVRITAELAEKIGSVCIFSGVGSWFEPFKPSDNPQLKDKWFLHGADRQRIEMGIRVAYEIACARSGEPMDGNMDLTENPQRVRDVISANGPVVVYGGYPEEDELFENKLLGQSWFPLPRDKVTICRRPDGQPMVSTPDQVEHYQSPLHTRDQSVAWVSSEGHLVRCAHVAGKFKENIPGNGKPIYPFPTLTQRNGIRGDGLRHVVKMECMGILAYIYNRKVATEDPYPFSFTR